MSTEDPYDDSARERLVAEPPKRVEAPVRTRVRARPRPRRPRGGVAPARGQDAGGRPADRRLRPQPAHAQPRGGAGRPRPGPGAGLHPDIAETAALAHDLGHPPFGHNGERVLAELSADCGGFEGNAQTLRLLTRLEAKTFDADGRSVGLNLTRATLDACTKYPWPRAEAPAPRGVHADGTPRVVVKFGVYDDDRPVFDWLRAGVDGRRASASRRR